jgi:hypothetical protein
MHGRWRVVVDTPGDKVDHLDRTGVALDRELDAGVVRRIQRAKGGDVFTVPIQIEHLDSNDTNSAPGFAE